MGRCLQLPNPRIWGGATAAGPPPGSRDRPRRARITYRATPGAVRGPPRRHSSSSRLRVSALCPVYIGTKSKSVRGLPRTCRWLAAARAFVPVPEVPLSAARARDARLSPSLRSSASRGPAVLPKQRHMYCHTARGGGTPGLNIGRVSVDFAPRLSPCPGQHSLPRLLGPACRGAEAAQGGAPIFVCLGPRRTNGDQDHQAARRVQEPAQRPVPPFLLLDRLVVKVRDTGGQRTVPDFQF